MPVLDQFTIQMPILIQPQPSHSHLHSSQSMTRRHSSHPHQRQSSKLHCHKWAVHRQELAQTTSILDQSEDSCAYKRGTSELCGQTEVSQRGTISQAKKRFHCSQSHSQFQSYSNPRECQSLTNLPIQCHSNTNLIPICHFG